MSDEIFFDGQRFISAAEASSAADLTRDYVARLCRDGKVKGRRIGKNWYVHEDSLKHFLVEQSHSKEVRRGQLSNERTREYLLAHRVTSPTSSDLKSEFSERDEAIASRHLIPIRRHEDGDVRSVSATKSLASHAMHVQRALQTKALARGEGAMRYAPSMLATPSGVHEAVMRTLGHGSMHVPVHTLTPFAEFLQKFVALLVAFSMTFGTYALVDPSYARFAIDSIQGSATSVSGVYVRVTGGGASALAERSREKMFFAAENPNAALAQVSGAALAFIPDTVRNLARAVNSGIDDLVYAIAFPDSVTNSMALTPIDGASVSIEIAPYAQGTQNTFLSATLAQAPAAQSSAPVAQNSNGAPVTIVERRVETERIVSAVGGITEDYLNQRLNTLESQITSRLLGVSSGGGGGYTTINNNYQMIAQSNNIDKLGSVAIDNSTFSGGTISGSAIENATITGTSFSGGSISATTLSASGASSFATTTISKLTVTGDTTLEGTLSIPGALSISSSTIDLFTNTYATTSFISAVTASTTNLTWANATGTNATTTNFFSTNASTTNATSTNLFATIGRFTSAFITALTSYGEVSAPSFSATSTTATSTFAGGILGTRVPTLPHTFGSWTIGASGANPFDASFVINPATAAGDTNLFAAAVGGSVKFLVDAEGDVFVNNLTSVGSVTLSTTTASTFTVEGNATFGDSISDITTVNGSLVVTGTTTTSTVQGNFGVGTSTPWGRLSIAGVAGGTSPLFTISSSTSGYATSTVFHIDSNGKVGVGTTSPSAKFAVDAPIYVGGSGVTATSTFEGNVNIQGLLKVGTSSTYISNSDISAIGNLSVSNATTTNLFSTTASSTNLFSTSATFGSLSVLGALSQTGLGTFANGFVSQASSTVAGAFTTTGTNTFGGALNIAGAITSTATSANTFPYASSTALTVSGTGYFGTASTTNLTVSSVVSGSLLKTTTGGSVVAATAGTDFENALTFSSPLSRLANTISIQDAAADGSTKGAASFTASDFDAVSGNIAIDYANGQAASGSLKGFLTSADWTTFNTKLASSSISNSAMLAALLSDEIGTGSVVLSASPTFTGTSIFANTTNSGTLGVSGLATFTQASSTRLSISGTAYFGGTATSTFDSAGNLSVAGTLGVTGNTTLANATTTNLFSTTASSTNLFSTSASFGSLSVLGALTQTGLGTFQNGFVSQASSTVVGAFTNTGAATFGSTLAASGLATLTSGFVSQASSTVVGAFTTTGTNTFGGALNIAGAITSTATSANTFPYASTTAITSANIYSTSASTTNLTVSSIPSAVLVTNSSGVLAAASAQTCTNQFIRSLSAAYVATCASVAPADLSNADFGDFTVSSAVASLDADTVSDSEIDYATVTLADFTNDADYVKWASATSTLWKSAGLLSTASSTIGGGTQATGLTISGGATTTGNAYFAGNVGVGTTTPGNTLSLNVGSDGRGIVFGSGSTLLGSLIRYAFNGATGSLALESGASSRPVALNYASAANVLLANGGGNVGVGTTSPYSKLTTWGTDSLFEAVTSSSSTVFSIGQNGATSTNFFSTTASSTNLFSTSATFGSLSVFGALSQTGLGTFTNGFVSQASSTVVGAFTTTGTNTFGGALNIAGAITSTASTANTFPYASSTALTGTSIYSSTASTTNLTVSGIQSSLIVTSASGAASAYSGSTCTNQFVRSLNGAGIATCASIAAADLANADWGDITISGGVASLDADTVSDSEIDYATVTLADFTNDANYAKTNVANSWTALQSFASGASSTQTSVFGSAYFGGSATSTFSSTGALTLVNALTLSGTTANVGLGSNYLSGDGGDEGVYVDSTGNVGVGTASPGSKLTVGSTNGLSSKLLVVSDRTTPETGAGANGILVDINGGGGIYMTGDAGVVEGKYEAYGGALGVGTMSAHPLQFYSSNNEVARFTASGSFGIGTTTPYWRLTIASSTGPQLALSDALGSDLWTFRNIRNNFYLATSTHAATSSVAAIAISGSTGALTFGSAATTTLTGGLQTAYLNITGTGATSTFASGINLSGGCLAVNGTCVGGGGSGATTGAANVFTALQTFSAGASTTQLSVFQKAYFGGTATTTIDSAGNLSVAGTLEVTGNTTLANATTTNLFSTTASSTNLFSTNATFGSLSVLGALSQTGLGTFTNGFVSQASSTVVGAFTTTGTNTFGGALNIAGAITSTAGTANTFPYASSTALTVSGTGYFGTASSSNLTVSSLTSGRVPFITTAGAFTDSSAFAFDSSLARLTVTNASTTALSVSGNAYFAGSGIWNSSGSVGVGTTSPYAKFSVQATGGQTNPVFEVASSSNSTAFLTVTSSGNVGIGTTTPSQKLAISGSTNTTLLVDRAASSNGNRIAWSTAGASDWAIGNAGNETIFSIFENNDTALPRLSVIDGGNVGIGTTSPFRLLSVTGAVATAQAALSYDTTRNTDFLTDSAGDLTINPSGDDVRLNDDNLWVCSGGSCPSGAPSGNGNLIVETKLGIGTSTPQGTLSVSNTTGSGDLNSALTVDFATGVYGMRFTRNGQSIFDMYKNTSTGVEFVTNANQSTNATFNFSGGNVGIGTSTPTNSLSVHGLLRVGANSVAPVTLGTATSTFNGDIKIIGKLDVGTIDPVYTIGGTKYATYGHSTVGIKEETVQTVHLEKADDGSYAYTIDFDHLQKGSDLWLFYQITDFGKNWSALVVSLTPAFEGTVYYKKNVAENTLTIKSNKKGEVSMRLVGNRFDFSKWPNLRSDQDGDTSGSHVISEKPAQ